MDSIPFTQEHIEKIREGEKQTTMRTIKKENLFRVGETYQVADEEDLKVKITMREIITFGLEEAQAFDQGTEIFPGTPAKHDALRTLEGFDDIGEMIGWFQSRGYNLPQEFFLYKLNPVEKPDLSEEKEDG